MTLTALWSSRTFIVKNVQQYMPGVLNKTGLFVVWLCFTVQASQAQTNFATLNTNGAPFCVFQVKVDNVTGTTWADARIYNKSRSQRHKRAIRSQQLYSDFDEPRCARHKLDIHCNKCV
jgi:hypothetical protein